MLENWSAHSFSYIDTRGCIKKPCWHRVGYIIWSWQCIIISEVQITFWMCFFNYQCSITRITWDGEKKNFSYGNKHMLIFWENSINFMNFMNFINLILFINESFYQLIQWTFLLILMTFKKSFVNNYASRLV